MGSSKGTFKNRLVAYRLKFSGRAVREIGEAFDWYEEQSKGLGSEFELAFELQLKRLEQVPLLYTEIIPGVRRTFSNAACCSFAPLAVHFCMSCAAVH